MGIPTRRSRRFLASKELAEWKLALERMLRYRPHTLGKKEEKLLAMQGQMSEASNQIFRQLNDADLKWGLVRTSGRAASSLAIPPFPRCCIRPSAAVRKEAFHAYYAQYAAHQNTIAAALNGSVQRDVYYARPVAIPSAPRGIALSRQCSGGGL